MENASEKLQGLSVLIVEDNDQLVTLTHSLLERFGVGRILTAPDGASGFQLICEHNPDIVISDWMMRPMDGLELTQLIRHDEASPNPTVPIILMTSLTERERIMQARDQGVTEFLPKPFTPHELYKRLMQVVERPRPFVEGGSFYGPDRRRTRDGGFGGPDRRGVQKKTVSFRFSEEKREDSSRPDQFPKIKPPEEWVKLELDD